MSEKYSITSHHIRAGFYLALRYYAAFTLMSYGFAKVMGAQFTILDSQLARPMGDVSGFWLTWYYFGYSPLYAAVIAWIQIGGALLLCFRRTTLLGAAVLLPAVVNIVLVDRWIIGWGLDSDAFRNALYVLLALLGILAYHARDLTALLRTYREKLIRSPRFRWPLQALQLAVVAGMVAYTAHTAHWIANSNNRSPTPIDGAWRVTQADLVSSPAPDWMYFEYNRAFWVEFHYPDGHWETHDFRVDNDVHSLSIGEEWLRPGTDIFEGAWSRQADRLVLTGKWKGGERVRLELARKEERIKDHG